MAVGVARPTGTLDLRVIREDAFAWPSRELTFREIAHYGMPHRGLSASVRRWRLGNWTNITRGARPIIAARALRIPHFYGALFLTVHRGDGTIVPLGLASLRLVTANGVKFICDDFNANAQDVTNMKFHGFGTGTNAEAATDTALQTELTTQYATDNTRPTGSQASATSGNNATYTTVATLSPDTGGTIAVTEHGILSQAATGGGTLLDRSVFSAVNLVAGSDSLQATYVLTINSGG